MQQRVEHEFDVDENLAVTGLSEELYRFAIMTGVVGLALIGLGVAAIVTEGYGSTVTGPATIVLGIVAMVGGIFFMRPRVLFDRIAHTRGSDVTKLMDALRFLDSAHAVFLGLLAAFVVLRLLSFLLIRMS